MMLLLIKQVLMGKNKVEKAFMRGGHWTCSKRTRTAKGAGLEWFGGLRPSAHQHERLDNLCGFIFFLFEDPEIPQNAVDAACSTPTCS